MFGFVSRIKYNRLAKARNDVFLEKEEIKHRLQVDIKRKDEEIAMYKKMYLDELQKRLELAKMVVEAKQ